MSNGNDFESEFEENLESVEETLETETLDSENLVEELEQLLKKFISDLDDLKSAAGSSLEQVEEVRGELEGAAEDEHSGTLQGLGAAEQEVHSTLSKLKKTREHILAIKDQLQVDLNVMDAALEKDAEAFNEDRELTEDLDSLRDEISD